MIENLTLNLSIEKENENQIIFTNPKKKLKGSWRKKHLTSKIIKQKIKKTNEFSRVNGKDLNTMNGKDLNKVQSNVLNHISGANLEKNLNNVAVEKRNDQGRLGSSRQNVSVKGFSSSIFTSNPSALNSNRNTNTSDRTINTSDINTDTSDRTINTSDRTINTSEKIIVKDDHKASNPNSSVKNIEKIITTSSAKSGDSINPTSHSDSKPVSSHSLKLSSKVPCFSDLGIHTVLASHLEKLKVCVPTPIQEVAIPKLISIQDKDMIIQAQTGSGKTFAFLLPILHNLVTAALNCEKQFGSEYFSRHSGAFAIILVPTRELAQQISMVLNSLLKYSGSGNTEENNNDPYCKHWIVSGLITGGESKKSEKARLRKGINILVATPGRLLDHLKTTESFQVGNLRWLVLDEADNLLHLGFEETLREILFILNERGSEATSSKKRMLIDNWPFERQTILCSATIEGGVERLAQQELRNPLFIKAQSEKDLALPDSTDSQKANDSNTSKDITIPASLKQLYVLSPAKLRLVNLIGLIRKMTDSGAKPCKVIVFAATGDSVDWHFDTLIRGGLENDNEVTLKKESNEDSGESQEKEQIHDSLEPFVYNDLPALRKGYQGNFLSNCNLFKLHGSMQQSERHAVYTGFSRPLESSTSSILICTDVAARGLDLPDVSQVIQYDPPADVRDYIHRIGRTARLGKDGQAFIFLLPSEVEYLDLLEDYKCSVREQPSIELLQALVPLASKPTMKKLKYQAHEIAATDVHMTLERFVQSSKRNLMHAQKAFSSFVRAYATHLASEKHIFHVKKLHLGHLAKSFCLQEAPAILQSKLGNLLKEKEKLASGGGVTAATMKRKALMMAKSMMLSEFSAGTVQSSAPSNEKQSKKLKSK